MMLGKRQQGQWVASPTLPGTTQEGHPVGVAPRETASRAKDLFAALDSGQAVH